MFRASHSLCASGQFHLCIINIECVAEKFESLSLKISFHGQLGEEDENIAGRRDVHCLCNSKCRGSLPYS